MLCSTQHAAPLLHLVGEQQNQFKHEEADVSIISFLLKLNEQHSHIQVTADDTDIFLLLVFYICKCKIISLVTMRKHDGRIININETVAKLGNKSKDILSLHALTGCDTVSYPFGKGKMTAVNMLMKSDLNLEHMCLVHTSSEEFLRIGTAFLVSVLWRQTYD